MSIGNEIDERFVADVIGPQCLPTAMLNIAVTQAGEIFEVWVQWGKKNWQVATGPLEQMNAKRDRLLRFIADPHAPVSSSVAEFVELAKGL